VAPFSSQLDVQQSHRSPSHALRYNASSALGCDAPSAASVHINHINLNYTLSFPSLLPKGTEQSLPCLERPGAGRLESTPQMPAVSNVLVEHNKHHQDRPAPCVANRLRACPPTSSQGDDSCAIDDLRLSADARAQGPASQVPAAGSRRLPMAAFGHPISLPTSWSTTSRDWSAAHPPQGVAAPAPLVSKLSV